jgi:hypothetical protein
MAAFCRELDCWRAPSFPATIWVGLPFCGLLVLPLERQGLSRQSHTPSGLDQLGLVCSPAGTVREMNAKEGWIKFREPCYEVGLN